MDEFSSASSPPSGLSARLERLGLRWLYGLMALPVLTGIVETGGLPRAPREWTTEVVAAGVIALLVRQVRKEHLAVLALARTDALTGLGNRRAFGEAIEGECSRARRSRVPLSLVYLDIDHFKQVNDRDGHARGDLILCQLAVAMQAAIRTRVDRGFRVGGDEFALLLPGTTAAQSIQVVARIRELCAGADAAWTGKPLGLSAGVVEFDVEETADAWVRQADAAMYLHKRAGRAGTPCRT